MRTHLLFSLTLLGCTLACREDEQSPTAPDASPAVATTASTLVFAQVSAGSVHTCGVTSDNRLFCWGDNSGGQLGDGTMTNRFAPVPVSGALRFRQVSAGYRSTCAVTTDNRAYCWGENERGQLGDGTLDPHLTPTAVTGGRLFRTVQITWDDTCGVTASGDRAFCWGDNGAGQLGIGNNTGPEVLVTSDGSRFPLSTKPVAVAGGLTFRHVSPGFGHACGVTTDDRVFCWGSNRYGQVGDGTAGWFRFKPKLIAGNRQYRQVDAGADWTCAVTTGNRAFCWGQGQFGVLGNGTQSSSRYPKPVSGGLSFQRVSAGSGFHTCGETTTNRAYCWGSNGIGQLGDGTRTDRLTPVAVVGGLSFSQVSAGATHSCGHTPQGRAYCWGANLDGQLGTGSTDIVVSPKPVPVAGPM